MPPAIKDPAFLGLKERLASLQKRYEESMQEMWDKVKALGADHEHRLAIPILQKALEEWEHPPSAKDGLLRRLEYHQAEVKRLRIREPLAGTMKKMASLRMRSANTRKVCKYKKTAPWNRIWPG